MKESQIQFISPIHSGAEACIRHTLTWMMKAHLVEGYVIQLAIEGEEQTTPESVLISRALVRAFESNDWNWKSLLDPKEPLIRFQDGTVDHLGTLVYFANYFQEYKAHTEDELGRFAYAHSYQHHYGVASQNLVMEHFTALARKRQWQMKKPEPSRVFVSHDNDGLYRSFVQDGKYALTNGKLGSFLLHLWRELTSGPSWFNMDDIMDINDRYDLKSTFFWLCERGEVQVGNRKLRNADYDIGAKAIQQQMKRISDRGFEQGLHKSISNRSFQSECEDLPFDVLANRNHFLRLRIPTHFKQMDEAGIALDFSLGFAEHIGLRNSYSLPYRPWDLGRNQATKTLYVPLWVMDTTNWSYMKWSREQFQSEVLSWMEANRADAVISVLWHNKYFSDLKFKGYKDIYIAILDRCRELGIRPTTQAELLEKYSGAKWE